MEDLALANGEYTAQEALHSDEAFRQYVVVQLERLRLRLDQHEQWHESRDKSIRWVATLSLGVPSTLFAAYLLFRLAVQTAGMAN